MKRHTPPSMRRASRVLPHALVGGGLLLIIFLAVAFGGLLLRRPTFRQAFVISGNPTYILSLTSTAQQSTLLTIPEQTVISAVDGYGRYSIRALTELDAIDAHNGSLVARSLSDALGIPISGYIGASELTQDVEGVEMLRRVFSWGSIVRVVNRTLITSLPFRTWLRLVWTLRFMPADMVEVIDLSPAVVASQSPDGSTSMMLDESKLDFLLQNSLFDSGLRGEGLTVAVYNTTRVPTVGQRAARLLSRMGIQLVFVGNAQMALPACQVAGAPAAMESRTVQFMRSYFRCSVAQTGEVTIGGETGADIIVLLGSGYAEQYK